MRRPLLLQSSNSRKLLRRTGAEREEDGVLMIDRSRFSGCVMAIFVEVTPLMNACMRLQLEVAGS
jgi:hypothetical protein